MHGVCVWVALLSARLYAAVRCYGATEEPHFQGGAALSPQSSTPRFALLCVFTDWSWAATHVL